MLIEQLEFLGDPRQLQLIFGLALGLVFGIAAQMSRFCLRRAVAGDQAERGSALAVWLTAFAVAIGGYFLAENRGLIVLDDHRLLSNSLPITAIVLGGLLFGGGMVLARGCVSRLTILSATGNLRAATVLIVFAVVAHAALKGVLAPARVMLGAIQVDTPIASLASIPGAAPVISLTILAAALILARRHGARPRDLMLGAVIGLVAVGGWMTTSTLLMDEFDPLPAQSAAFTLPWSETLFWIIASSAIPAGFGTGLVGGVLLGSFLSAALRGELQAQSFSSAGETLRYVLGGALMGAGGVLAGGCTVGAGLSGGAMLSVAALIALLSIVLGAVLTRQVFQRRAVPAAV